MPYFPALQFEHDDDPAVEYFPAGQLEVQVEILPPDALYFPAAQLEQELSDETRPALWYLPAGQQYFVQVASSVQPLPQLCVPHQADAVMLYEAPLEHVPLYVDAPTPVPVYLPVAGASFVQLVRGVIAVFA